MPQRNEPISQSGHQYKQPASDKTMHKMLMFAYYFPPMNESGAQRPFRFSKYLRIFDVLTQVVMASDDGKTNAVLLNENYTDKVAEPTKLITVLARIVQRLLPYNDQLTWVPYAIAAAERVLADGDVFAMLSTSPPSATHIAAFLLKRRYGIRWIADLRDPIYQNPFRRGRVAGWWDHFIEWLVITYADGIVGNTAGAVEELKKRYSRFSSKIFLIWNGYDPEEELTALPISNQKHLVLTHAGSLYSGRHPGQLLASLSRLITQGVLSQDHIRVRLIGYINLEEPWVAHYNFRSILGEPWLECVNRVLPRQEALNAIATSNYLLLFDINERGVGLQVPAKLFEYIRIGRPILAFTTPGSPTEYILSRSGIPHTCIYQNSTDEETDNRLLFFLRFSSEPVSPSEWFRKEFDAAVQTKILASMLGVV